MNLPQAEGGSTLVGFLLRFLEETDFVSVTVRGNTLSILTDARIIRSSTHSPTSFSRQVL